MQLMSKVSLVEWEPCFRIIPSRFPPIHLYERVVSNEEFEILNEIEAMTNPRHRDEVGAYQLVEAGDRIFGPGTSRIMAAFTHINAQGSRFSNGTYGVYYAGKSIETCIAETRFHGEKFLSATKEKKATFEMLVLAATLSADLHDIRGQTTLDIYHPSDYLPAQRFANDLRANQSNGIVYNSVRHTTGECVAIFKPKALKSCIDWKRLNYHWNGESIDYTYSPSDLTNYK